jgi:hypothetical protein
MKKVLFSTLLLMASIFSFGQVTYYWVGGTTPTTSITIGTNWNSSLDGTGVTRPSSSGASDVLVIDGTNVGGATPATGTVAMLVNGSITCGQMKFVNNASTTFVRAATGTSTITISGDVGEDFIIEAGSTLSCVSPTGSLRFAMGASNTARVSGALNIITPLQTRFDNTTAGTPGSFVFTSGSSLTTNITATASSYAFGSATQSSEKWVVFEAGAHLYYNGGYSPMGGTSTYSAIDFKPGSFWHHRANNGLGSFFNRKSFGHIIVENNATLTADGSIFRIGDLTVEAGSAFVTYTSGQTVVLGNVVVNGSLTSDVLSSNELILSSANAQSITGTGTIDIARLIVAGNARVSLGKNINLNQSAKVYGQLNFGTKQLTGPASFTASGIETTVSGSGNTIIGSFFITGNVGIPLEARGQNISGTSIAPNTSIVAFSLTLDTIFLSQPLLASGTAVPLIVNTAGATLQTASSNGFNPATGSVMVAGTKNYLDQLSYIIDASNTQPFGISTSSAATTVNVRSVIINAAVTANSSVAVSGQLTLNGKLVLRPLDTLHILNGAGIAGTFGAANYIATDYNAATGDQSIVLYDGLAAATTLPIGTINYYLPVSINPAAVSNFKAAVFQGITTNGTITGTPFTALQKQTVVNAVWNLTRLSGTGNAVLGISWDAALEGSTFTTLPGTDIGLIQNTGALWSTPLSTGNNTTNTTSTTLSSFGAISAGAIQQVDPFVFNVLPVKTYGNADFTGGATSLNTAQPIVYTSSNPAVATIVSGAIHITGAGTTDINAAQLSDGFYPAASITRSLTVNKAALTITADNKIKFESEVNPALTATYTGFVLGETSSVLLTPTVISTTAVTASLPGNYPITVSGATSNNYTISFVNGIMTIQPKQTQTITFNTPAVKTYGNADFAIGASSTNTTIPLTYSSSNTSVATFVGNNIHIVGAGTADITVSQTGSVGYFPATAVTKTLTVNKVNLTVKVFDSSRLAGEANPVFRVSYTGFVLGETSANITILPLITTIATAASAPGNYPVLLQSAISQNYNFIYVNGKLTVLPLTGTTELYLSAFLSSSRNLNVRVYSPKPALGDVMLFDMTGRMVAKKNLFMPVGFINTELVIPAVSNGTYVVCVRGDGVNLQTIIQIIK